MYPLQEIKLLEIDSFVEENSEHNHLQYLQVNQYIDPLLISTHSPKNG